MDVLFLGGSANGHIYTVSLPLPETYTLYDPTTRKYDHYELRQMLVGIVYYHYVYSTEN